MQKTQPAKMERWISTFCKAKPICTLATSTYFFIPSLTQVSWLCFIQSQILRQKPSQKLYNSNSRENLPHLLHNPSQKWGIACLVSTPICLSVCKFLTERVVERGTVAKMKIERMCRGGLVNERFQVQILSKPPIFVEMMVICTM